MAAGEGARFRASVKISHKGLVYLGGLRIIERVIFAFHKYSVNNIVIVVGYNSGALKSHLGRGERYSVRIQYVENQDWKKGNGTSLYAAREALSGEDHFLVSMADHWYEPEVIGEMLKSGVRGNLLCVDRNIQGVSNLEDATKIDIDDSGLIRSIGKDLKQYDAIDCGIFISSKEVFDALQESFIQGDYSLTGGIRVLARKGRIATHDIGGHLWQDIDTERDLAIAERKIFSSLKGKGDGLVSRHLNRHLSIPLTKAIANYAVPPNQITVASFLLCLIAGLLFFLGTPIFVVLAGVLAQLSSVVDGVDGELARLKFASTSYGSYLDSILDRYGDAVIILGMAYYSYTSVPEHWVLLTAILALLGSGMSMMSRDAFFRSFGRRYNPADMDGAAKFLFAGRDGRLFLIFLGGVTNQVLLAMAILAVTTNLLAIYRLLAISRIAKKGQVEN
ncbi:MAG: NTP transferase domain-containing protein [Candidatus Bathyarchaeia archaeon]